MTNKEAIDKLIMLKSAKALRAKVFNEDGKPLEPDFETAVNKAIEALEKQIPKKPINWCGKMLICPNCARAEYIKKIDMLDTYCGFCGQSIDWSEVK